jgi:hypothetical protein
MLAVEVAVELALLVQEVQVVVVQEALVQVNVEQQELLTLAVELVVKVFIVVKILKVVVQE